MPDQTSLTGDMARVAADLLDELALVFGAVPHSAHVFRNYVVLTYLEPADRRAGADALGLRGTAWGYGRVDQSGFVATDHGSLGEVEVIVSSSPDTEDWRRRDEDAETAARAAAAVTS